MKFEKIRETRKESITVGFLFEATLQLVVRQTRTYFPTEPISINGSIVIDMIAIGVPKGSGILNCPSENAL